MLRLLTAGESHGPELTAILDGFPAGLKVDLPALDAFLARRQKGHGSGPRMKIEKDTVRISAGVLGGKTTGAPIALHIANLDHKQWADKDIPPFTIPRPGHADLAGAVKYGHGDFRVTLERASARETAIRTAAGALCVQLLHAFGIRVGAFVSAIGAVEARLESDHDWQALWQIAEADPVRCPDPAASEEMVSLISRALKERDTLGGAVVVAATGLPAGLGSCMQADRRLDGLLMGRLGAIPSVKGVVIGIDGAHLLRGTQVHDAIRLEADRLVRPTNRAGGIEGGISNGEPVVAHVFFKPLSTLLKGLPSVDLSSGSEADAAYERSDVCAVPRAAVVCEAVMALVLSEALIEKLGGDSVEEMGGRFKELKQPVLGDLKMEDPRRLW